MYLLNERFKKVLAVVSVLLAVMIFAGCSGAKSYSPDEIVKQVYSNNKFSGMNYISGDKLSAYFQFSDTDVVRFSVMISSSNENSDVIASFEYENDEKRLTVINGITQYLINKSATLKNNLVAEYDKVQNRVLMDVGNTVTLVICSESQNVQSQLTKMNGVVIS